MKCEFYKDLQMNESTTKISPPPLSSTIQKPLKQLFTYYNTP